MGHARALLALTGEAQIEAVNKIINGKLTSAKLNNLCRALKILLLKTLSHCQPKNVCC